MKWECFQCNDGKLFCTWKSLRTHTRRFHELERNYKCRLCETTYLSAWEAESHIDRVHGREFSEEEELEATLTEYQHNIALSCSICQKGGFRRLRYLTNHEIQCARTWSRKMEEGKEVSYRSYDILSLKNFN